MLRFSLSKITDFGDLKELKGCEYKVHPDTHLEKGGILIRDEAKIIPAAFKEIANKVASQLAKGKITNLSKTPAPAYLHHYFTHQHMLANDIINVHHLRKAATLTDPVERLKLLIQFFMTSHFINPTLVQCRIPLVPILGETYQLEMATGEKLYIEQICHHPSITAFLLEGDGFTYSGSYQINASLNGPNSIKGWKEGK